MGSAMVERFLANQDTVIAADLNKEGLDSLGKKQNGTIKFVTSVADISKEEDCNRLATMTRDKAAKALDLPVVLTTSQEDDIQGPLPRVFENILPEAYKNRIKRAGTVNAWADPKFAEAVQATGRKNLIMGGVTTDICLIFPSMSAVQGGYNVQAVIDASGSSYDLQEEMSRRRMEKAGVVLTTTNTIIAELVQDWSTKAGMELVKLMVMTAPMMQPVE